MVNLLIKESFVCMRKMYKMTGQKVLFIQMQKKRKVSDTQIQTPTIKCTIKKELHDIQEDASFILPS